jgi:hypothetical protein
MEETIRFERDDELLKKLYASRLGVTKHITPIAKIAAWQSPEFAKTPIPVAYLQRL